MPGARASSTQSAAPSARGPSRVQARRPQRAARLPRPSTHRRSPLARQRERRPEPRGLPRVLPSDSLPDRASNRISRGPAHPSERPGVHPRAPPRAASRPRPPEPCCPSARDPRRTHRSIRLPWMSTFSSTPRTNTADPPRPRGSSGEPDASRCTSRACVPARLYELRRVPEQSPDSPPDAIRSRGDYASHPRRSNAGKSLRRGGERCPALNARTSAGFHASSTPNRRGPRIVLPLDPAVEPWHRATDSMSFAVDSSDSSWRQATGSGTRRAGASIAGNHDPVPFPSSIRGLPGGGRTSRRCGTQFASVATPSSQTATGVYFCRSTTTPAMSLAGRLRLPPTPRHAPLVVLIHGLSGCEASPYMQLSAHFWSTREHPVLRLNLRGAGPSREHCRYQYHAGRSLDLRNALGARSTTNSSRRASC